MSVIYAFDEVLFDPAIFTAGDAQGGPAYDNTLIRQPPTGVFKINVTRYDYQQIWVFDLNLLSPSYIEYLNKIWVGGFGSAYGLRVRVVTDFVCVNEVIGVGDGNDSTFQLTKTYRRPAVMRQYVRKIIKPVVNAHLSGDSVTLYEPDGQTSRVIPSGPGAAWGATAFKVMLDGVETTAYTIKNTTGLITFTSPPGLGVEVSWTGEFDTPMRFLQNSIPLKADVASEVKSVSMAEIMPSELGL